MTRKNKRLSLVLSFDNLKFLSCGDEQMFLDEALDLIGRSMRPKTWGTINEFKLLPFMKHKYSFRRGIVKSLSSARFKKVSLEIDERSLREIYRPFRSACRQFLEGMRSQQFRARCRSATRGLLEPPISPDALEAQMRFAFTTGYAFPPDALRDTKPLPIIIERPQFELWLANAPFSAKLSEIAVSSVLSKAVIRSVITRNIGITEKYILSVMQTIGAELGQSYSANNIKTSIWKNGCSEFDALKIRRRPSKDQLASMRTAKSELISAVVDAVRSRSC